MSTSEMQLIFALLEKCIYSCCGRQKDDRSPLAVTATVIGMGRWWSQKTRVGCSVVVLTLFGTVLPRGSCVLLLLLSLAEVAKLGFVSWSQAFQWRGVLGFPPLSRYVIVPSWIVREFIYSCLGFLHGVSCCRSLLCLLLFCEKFLV